MRIRTVIPHLLLVALAGPGPRAIASEPPVAPVAVAAPTVTPTPMPSPRAFVTRHTGRFGPETVAYGATAGETYLRDDKGGGPRPSTCWERASAPPARRRWRGGSRAAGRA